jgi:hypothetical protein
MSKPQTGLVVTPFGTIAGFTAIQEARPNFNKTADEYQIVVAFEAREFAAFSKKLHAMRDAYVAQRLEALDPAKRKVLERGMSKKDVGTPEVDEAGDETGRYLVKFRQSARIEGTSKKTGKPFVIEKKVALVDSQGKAIKTKLRIGKGSTVAVSFEPNPYYSEKDKEFGISFNRLIGVQIVKLIEYEGDGEMSADAMGFGAVEDGFSAEDYVSEDGDEDTGGFGPARGRVDLDDEIPF